MSAELKSFIALVSEMRLIQKQYFKNRMSFDLEKAKRLEKEVDNFIKSFGEEEIAVQKKYSEKWSTQNFCKENHN